MLRLTIGSHVLMATLEEERAPKTCAVMRRLLPLRDKVIHARWCGDAIWVPMSDRDVRVEFENHTSYPAPGEILLYPGGYSEAEMLIVYGAARFTSMLGPLAGNRFATLVEARDLLHAVGRQILWEGAQDIGIEEV
jgi:hypothetical protein